MHIVDWSLWLAAESILTVERLQLQIGACLKYSYSHKKTLNDYQTNRME